MTMPASKTTPSTTGKWKARPQRKTLLPATRDYDLRECGCPRLEDRLMNWGVA